MWNLNQEKDLAIVGFKMEGVMEVDGCSTCENIPKLQAKKWLR